MNKAEINIIKDVVTVSYRNVIEDVKEIENLRPYDVLNSLEGFSVFFCIWCC
ncbi:MAG: hypothetical protein IPG09_03635 [Ignavibacteria bacterium]|nr:hypothetical protein [Ignavibacteria bacterium]